MFFKPIVTLLLMIAIGLIGTSSLGEGIFGFKTTASGTKVLEEVRDYDVAMDTFKVSDAEVRSVVQVADATDATAGNVTQADINSQLITNTGLLEVGANQTVAGAVTVELVNGVAAVDGLYITIAGETGTGLSDDLCNELNDLLGNDATATFGTEMAPLIPAAADLDAVFTALPGLELGATTEGVCAAINDVNTLVFFSQQN